LTVLAQPDQGGDKGKKAQIAAVEFVKARENAPGPLAFVEKIRNEMAFLVQMLVISAGVGAVLAGRNDTNRPQRLNQADPLVIIKGFVGNHLVAAPSFA
jgi:hypothetical protein